MTATRLEEMLRLADLSDETNRMVLADALEDAGFPAAGQSLRQNRWFAEGYDDATDCCCDLEAQGVDLDEGANFGAWDDWALRGITTEEFAESLGLAADLQDDDEDVDYPDHPAWAAACREYDRGGRAAVEEFLTNSEESERATN